MAENPGRRLSRRVVEALVALTVACIVALLAGPYLYRLMRPGATTASVPYGSTNCNPGDSCRGIYISDRPAGGPEANRNTFRVWYLMILPTSLVAGFSLGRAGRMPGRRQTRA
jgi:hypothetical protein